mmetsp:Transcript_52648/g.157715  ORF Transcript_52648/g.157715 Transcript_52648/m.157715 type:complete len:270 (-) Transcript_52648:260-1069(-)|eukprot:CAMPEP_0113552792 /NCGR_PEP_ID=MMETSP0015_2-20120614/15258_1 /TAXON_ID=2838 /ORGANISM="Odontella" /LENGTH=269 /DNA_ID=CAMNT_0000453797 /DNA_START=99 /DNA_END=908 /DNA_ORIENTATION=+ /assembly_acc=CAM_ASM_000160
MPYGAGEKAPLTDSQTAQLHAAGTVISDLATAENVKAAAGYTAGKIQQAYGLATDANTPLRMMALLAGVAMLASSILTMLGKIVRFNIADSILSLYCVFLAVIIIMLEGRWIPFQKKFQSKVRKYALFLDFVWGRGILYFVAGSLQFVQLTLLDAPVGLFTMFVGMSYYINGRNTSNKLSELRKSLFSVEELRRRFDEVDVTGKGEIDFAHFKVFVERLGLVLSQNELEAAFDNVDLDHGGTIEFEEFLLWWQQWDFDQVERGNVSVMV